MNEFLEQVADTNPGALTADGFEGCELGLAFRATCAPVIAYDRGKCIQRLMERDGMSQEDAEEFFEFNVIAAWVGDGTPIFVEL
jgi:hypothetical protein